MISIKDIGWVAGFLEGEADFGYGHGLRIRVGQKHRWALDKLQLFFGGRIALIEHNGLNGSPIYHWRIGSIMAASIMMTILNMMSPIRQEKIRAILAVWKTKKLHGRDRTVCIHGHVLDRKSFYTTKSGERKVRRNCFTCHKVSRKKYLQKKRGL